MVFGARGKTSSRSLRSFARRDSTLCALREMFTNQPMK